MTGHVIIPRVNDCLTVTSSTFDFDDGICLDGALLETRRCRGGDSRTLWGRTPCRSEPQTRHRQTQSGRHLTDLLIWRRRGEKDCSGDKPSQRRPRQSHWRPQTASGGNTTRLKQVREHASVAAYTYFMAVVESQFNPSWVKLCLNQHILSIHTMHIPI